MAVLTELQLLRELDKLIRQTRSVNRAAKVLGVSRQFLKQVLTGVRPPGKKIPAALGLKRSGRVYETEDVL